MNRMGFIGLITAGTWSELSDLFLCSPEIFIGPWAVRFMGRGV